MNTEADDSEIITIQLNDGAIVECDVVSIFPVSGIPDRQFIALNPLTQSPFGDPDEIQLFALKAERYGDGHELAVIEDEELEAVVDEFYRIVES